MSEKLCLYCKHWYFDGGEQGYSELTPGSDMGIECLKGHWRIENGSHTGPSFRQTMERGLECKDFEEIP